MSSIAPAAQSKFSHPRVVAIASIAADGELTRNESLYSLVASVSPSYLLQRYGTDHLSLLDALHPDDAITLYQNTVDFLSLTVARISDVASFPLRTPPSPPSLSPTQMWIPSEVRHALILLTRDLCHSIRRSPLFDEETVQLCGEIALLGRVATLFIGWLDDFTWKCLFGKRSSERPTSEYLEIVKCIVSSLCLRIIMPEGWSGVGGELVLSSIKDSLGAVADTMDRREFRSSSFALCRRDALDRNWCSLVTQEHPSSYRIGSIGLDLDLGVQESAALAIADCFPELFEE
eukprot:gene1951-2303_t